jgi:hypothetical protein
MADNTDEKHLDNPTNNQSENPPDEINPANDTETITPNQETENMEVHHHSHHEGKKNWKSYFREFLMLFLAVFCGFLAEYQLEHTIEHQREKKYIQSLHSDLEADISRLKEILQLRNDRAMMLDSFSNLLNSREALSHINDLYYYNSFATRGVAFRFTPVDGTMQQLKNGGNLRLVRKNIVSDSIISYDVAVRALMFGTNDEEVMMGTYRNIAEGIFDGVVLNSMRDDDNNVNRLDYNPSLRLTDDSKLRLNYRIHMLTVFNKTMRKEGKKLVAKAQRLSQLLKKEYHLE